MFDSRLGQTPDWRVQHSRVQFFFPLFFTLFFFSFFLLHENLGRYAYVLTSKTSPRSNDLTYAKTCKSQQV